MTAPALLLDFVSMTVASAPGTGTVSLGVATPGGSLSFASAGAINGATYRYQIIDGSNREICYGVYNSSGPSIGRNTVVASVNGAMQVTPITASANAVITTVASSADTVTPGFLRTYLSGGTLSNDATSPNTVIDVSAFSCCSDDFTTLMSSSAFTKSLSAWSAGSGNGGLDTGSVAALTWYHVFGIERLDTRAADGLISLSPTAPSMPANYTVKRRLGSILTDASSNIIPFTQFNDHFLWKCAVNDLSGSAPSGGQQFYVVTVPTGVQVFAECLFEVSYNGSSDQLFPFAPDMVNQGNTGQTSAALFVQSASQEANAWMSIRTNTNGEIGIYGDIGNCKLYITTSGWRDPLGRNA